MGFSANSKVVHLREFASNSVTFETLAPEEFDRVLRYLARNFTKVNVNSADAAQIAPVLGVSEAAAQGVVEFRAQHGNFGNFDDLKKVPGLDSARIDERKQRIAFR